MKFLKVLLFLFVLVPLFVFLSLSVLTLPGLITIFIISAITGDSADNVFEIIIGVIVSALFYLKTNLGRKIVVDYLLKLSDKFADFVK